MAWGVFFLVLFVGYAGYYTVNVLYDLLRGGTSKAAAGGVHYSLPDLAEEEPYEVTDEDNQEQGQDYQDEPYEEEYEDEFEEEFEEEEPGTGTAPALKVEGQGIPLDEFLRDAKSYAGSIFGD